MPFEDIFKFSPLLWCAVGVIVALAGAVAALYGRCNKLSNKLNSNSEQHSQRIIEVLTKANTELQANVDKGRDKDERYNMVLSSLIGTIKELDNEPALAEVRRELESMRRDLNRISGNQLAHALTDGVPQERLNLIPNP